MSTIKSSTTTTTAYSVSADTTGTLVIQTGSTPTTAVTVGTDQSVTLAGTLALQSQNMSPYTGFKNRLINSAMVIDQRNAGASVTITNTSDVTYTLDRFFAFGTVASKFSVEQTITGVSAPVGFTDYLAVTSSSAYPVISSDSFSLGQSIEGFNTADLAWGTASAATITLSFWVRSSLTGTFGGSLRNSAVNRSYPFTYTISAANTWEQKAITIAGDTSGTWVGATNGVGIRVGFGLGQGSTFNGTAGAWAVGNFNNATGATSVVGTNGATFYITGVQLEKGSTATSFDYRPYGTELQLCQRYYEKSYNMASIAGASTNTGKGSFVIGAAANTFWRWSQSYKVSKRGDASFTIYSTTGASGNVRLNNASDLAVTTEDAGENACAIYVSRNASLGDFFWWQWTASSEL